MDTQDLFFSQFREPGAMDLASRISRSGIQPGGPARDTWPDGLRRP